jgi:hypothetical protein
LESSWASSYGDYQFKMPAHTGVVEKSPAVFTPYGYSNLLKNSHAHLEYTAYENRQPISLINWMKPFLK